MRANARQRALFDFLRDCEEANRAFSIPEAAESTGLKAGSLTTYISKKLKGVLVHRCEADRFQVRGVQQVTFDQFQAILSQTTGAAFRNYHEWRLVLRSLLEEGYRLRFPVDDTLRQLASSLEGCCPLEPGRMDAAPTAPPDKQT